MASITLAPVNILHVAYVTVALFSILLVAGRPQCKALVLLLGVHLVQEFLNPFEELNVTHYLLTPAFQLAFGPLYYLFVKNMIYGDIDLRRQVYHFIPTIVALALTRWWPVELMVAFAVLVTYMFFSMRLLRHYHMVLKETLSDGENHSLRWLTRTLVIIFIVEFVDFTRLNLQQVLNQRVLTDWYFFSTMISLSCTAYLVLKAVRQPLLFNGIARLEKIVITAPSESGQDQELATRLFTAIDTHQRQTLAYRQPKYSLSDLASDMGFTEQDVSWALNRGGGKSFSDFINDLRLEDVKAALADPGSKNFLDIAYMAGFSSKSTFNAVFKKSTGMTPSQYCAQDRTSGKNMGRTKT